MAVRSVSSLLLDELLSQILYKMRKRAAQKHLFSGIVVPIDDLIGRRVIATGLFEATQIDGITRLLEHPETIGLSDRPKGIFVDVGANIGLFTIAFSRFFERTLAIEANPSTFSILNTNARLRALKDVHCICAAVSNTTQTTNLFVPTDHNLGHATLHPAEGRSSASVQVACRLLDDILDENAKDAPVGLIKIDVEGHEPSVIEGARRILLRDHPVVLFEALTEDDAKKCAVLLFDCGYRRFFRFRRGKPGRPISNIVTALLRGVDVFPEEMELQALHNAPLLCATP